MMVLSLLYRTLFYYFQSEQIHFYTSNIPPHLRGLSHRAIFAINWNLLLCLIKLSMFDVGLTWYICFLFSEESSLYLIKYEWYYQALYKRGSDFGFSHTNRLSNPFFSSGFSLAALFSLSHCFLRLCFSSFSIGMDKPITVCEFRSKFLFKPTWGAHRRRSKPPSLVSFTFTTVMDKKLELHSLSNCLYLFV